MCLAAGGAMVTVKYRAMEVANKVKILPVSQVFYTPAKIMKMYIQLYLMYFKTNDVNEQLT
jgi:hypothetical protein